MLEFTSMRRYYKYFRELYSEKYYVQRTFDPDFDGACPCFYGEFTFDGEWVSVQGRCWRVAKYGSQDLILESDRLTNETLEKLGTPIKHCLDQQEWYNDYQLVVDGV